MVGPGNNDAPGLGWGTPVSRKSSSASDVVSSFTVPIRLEELSALRNLRKLSKRLIETCLELRFGEESEHKYDCSDCGYDGVGRHPDSWEEANRERERCISSMENDEMSRHVAERILSDMFGGGDPPVCPVCSGGVPRIASSSRLRNGELVTDYDTDILARIVMLAESTADALAKTREK